MSCPAKLLVIGLDAAEPALLQAWADDGHLPALRALRDGSLYARTQNPPGLYTGAVWPSFATGLSPGRHGRYFYRQIRTGTYDVVPFAAEQTAGEPFWSALGRAGRRCAIVDVPKAAFGDPGAGLQIRDWGVHDPEGAPCSRPESLIGEITHRFGADPVGNCDLGRSGAKPLAELRDGLLERVRRKTALTAELLGRGGWDLFLTVFAESHCAGHQFWHVHDPTHPRHRPDVAAALGDPLRDVYVALDTAVGRLVELAGPDTTVLVFASHGMGAHYDGTFLLGQILRRIEGVPEPRRTPALEAARRLWQRAPASVRRRLQPVADRAYQVARSGVPSGRRFFAVPTNDNCGGIRLNIVGREPRGRVRRGGEADAVCAELTAELLALRDVERGRAVVREVLRSAEVFPGEHVDDLPDLIVRWHRDAPIRGVVSTRVGRIERPDISYRSGDHRAGGALYARRPGLASGVHPEVVSITDFAPTIAALLGVALDDVDGRPIAAIV